MSNRPFSVKITEGDPGEIIGSELFTPLVTPPTLSTTYTDKVTTGDLDPYVGVPPKSLCDLSDTLCTRV